MKLEHIIIGAGRSGTTSLVEYLRQNNAINFSKIKEVTYFSVDDHYKRGTNFLDSFFEKRLGINSISDTYLLINKDAPKRIAEYNPRMKIGVILRHPTERTFSAFNYAKNNGYIDENSDFVESENLESRFLKISNAVKQNNHCNFYGSLYHKHLSHWLGCFPKEQFFICTTQQLKENPQELFNQYFDFLNVPKIEINPINIQNKAAEVKNKALNDFLINRDNRFRRIIRKPLQIPFVRNRILNSNIVESIKNKNRKESTNVKISEKEKVFCDNYFAEDLKQLEKDFGIKF